MKALMLLAFSLTTTFSFQAFSNVGFLKGNKTDITLLDGYATVQCRDSYNFIDQRRVSCSGYLVSPVSHDYLAAPGINADKVTLVSTRVDGTTRKASSKFDSDKGQTKSRFNLAISSLTQRPLLKVGENVISYEFTKGSQSVASGEFTAVMEIAEERKCGHDFLYLSHMDCSNTMFICDEYFRLNKNCTN